MNTLTVVCFPILCAMMIVGVLWLMWQVKNAPIDPTPSKYDASQYE